MSEQTIISIISALVSVIAILGLVVKMSLNQRSNNNNRKAGNPINLHNFIVDCEKEHQEQISLLETIKEALTRIEGKLK